MPSQTPKQVVFHPLLFAAFPPLFLLSTNANFLAFADVIGPLLLCATAVGLTWLFLFRVTKDLKRSAMITSLGMFIFFSFGPMRDILGSLSAEDAEAGLAVGWRVLLMDLLVVVVAAVGYRKLDRYSHEVTYLFNVCGTVLIAFPLVGAVGAAFQRQQASRLLPDRALFEAPMESSPPDASLPDIYYIILDGYGSAGFLKDEFGFDNSRFIDYLSDRGFFVGDDSKANYPQTLLSLGASLNFSYLDKPFGQQLANVKDRNFLREIVANNRAVRFLRASGYSIVSISGLYSDADIGNTDIRLDKWWMLNSFEANLFVMTPIPWVCQQMGRPLIYDMHRANILNSFEGLAEAVALPGPKLVFSYIFAAHPPFVFGPNGEPINRAERYNWDDGDTLMEQGGEARQDYIRAYRDQVRYLNDKTMEAVSDILTRSATPPVILIQGDHGPGTRFSKTDLAKTDVRERFSILNAYYMPDGGDQVLYESISPVNSFRAIFNRYLGTNLPLLEDCSLYTPWFEPYNFMPVSCAADDTSISLAATPTSVY